VFLVRRRTFFVAAVPLLLLALAQPTLALFAMGCVLALFGEAIRVWAAGTIHKTRHVTTAGPYSYVRHPLYFGSFFVAMGHCFMCGAAISFAIMMPLFFLFHGAAVWMEERTLKVVFGEEYERYTRQVGRAIPRLTPLRERHGSFQWRQVLLNDEHVNAIFTTILAGLFGLILWLQ
jgi:protein-S-isoprenylcysteine O-methyltransferase Ste14